MDSNSLKNKIPLYRENFSKWKENLFKKPAQQELKKIKDIKRKMGIDSKKVELVKHWSYAQDIKHFDEIIHMIEYYCEDMTYCIRSGEQSIMESLRKPNEALASFCFNEYIIADSFYSLITNKVKEEFLHLSETKCGIKDLKKLIEIGYKLTIVQEICVFIKRVFMYILNEILNCTPEELTKKCNEYRKMKEKFLLDGDMDFYGYDNHKGHHYKIYDYFEGEEYDADKLGWGIVMFHYNPVNLIEVRENTYILYKITKIKKTVRNMIRQYLNKNNQTYTEQDIINIGNEYTLIVETNKGHDKLCNRLLDLIVRVMNKGDTNVNKHLIYLINILISIRNNRRMKKQGYIGSLDMYRSRLGIDKTPSALHKLLF